MNTAMIWQTISTASADTEKLGLLLGQNLSPPALVELVGDLGSGKTTFVRGLAKGLKSSDQVASPTFTLNKVYKFTGGQIHHFDFYRLSEAGVIAEQLAESLDDPKVITVVEWGDIVKEVLAGERLSIQLAPRQDNPDERQITINYPEAMANVVKRIETDWEQNRP